VVVHAFGGSNEEEEEEQNQQQLPVLEVESR
jgi:hypothetical protein